MTDFHTHILPGMDDGSRSLEESLEMIRLEMAQGISRIVLTPHFYPGEESPGRFLARRQAAWDTLSPHLEAGMPEFLLGAEVQYFEGICRVPEIRDLRIQGTELLLLEMPFGPWTSRMIQDVQELNRQPGIQVVLAHIERYLGQNSQYLPALLSNRVLFQANVSFFSRWQTRRKAMRMLKRGQLRFAGSDCHSMKHRRPNWERFPAEAVQLLKT